MNSPKEVRQGVTSSIVQEGTILTKPLKLGQESCSPCPKHAQRSPLFTTQQASPVADVVATELGLGELRQITRSRSAENRSGTQRNGLHMQAPLDGQPGIAQHAPTSGPVPASGRLRPGARHRVGGAGLSRTRNRVLRRRNRPHSRARRRCPRRRSGRPWHRLRPSPMRRPRRHRSPS